MRDLTSISNYIGGSNEMKVLFLTNIPSPYRVDFFNELGKLCELSVLFERRKASDRDGKWKAFKSEYFKEIFLKGIAIGNDSGICPSIIRYLKDKQYDVIVIGGYSTPTGMLAIEYLRLKRIPYILNCDGGMIKNDKGLKLIIKKHFISKASAWLSTGKKTSEYLLHYGATKEEIYTYPFTSLKNEDIITQIINKDEKQRLRNRLNIKEDKIIISAGQFIHRKGYDVLLNGCKNIEKSIGIYIIGGNPTEEYLQLKKNFNLKNVYFVGFKTKIELKEYYMAADLFVLPTREDVWGLVINEAMAYGLPVITTDKCIAGLELVKNHENGFIVPVDDEKKLADKMNIILSDDELRGKMAQSSLYKIREYTIENMANKHMEIFESIIDKNLYSD